MAVIADSYNIHLVEVKLKISSHDKQFNIMNIMTYKREWQAF